MCGIWPLSAKLDFRRKRLSTIPHFKVDNYLHSHKISLKYLDRLQGYAPKTKFETAAPAAVFYFWFQFGQVSFFGDLHLYTGSTTVRTAIHAVNSCVRPSVRSSPVINHWAADAGQPYDDSILLNSALQRGFTK